MRLQAVGPTAALAVAVALVAGVGVGVGCGGAPGRDAGAVADGASATAAVRYVVRVTEDLSTMSVGVCFRGAPPRALTSTSREAPALLRYVRVRDGAALGEENGVIELRDLENDGCVDYEVDIEGGARNSRRTGDLESAIVMTAGAWLWAPTPRRTDARVELVTALPVGMTASLPWPKVREGRVHRLDERAFRLEAYTAFGRFELEQIAVPGAELEVAVVSPERAPSPETIRRWLEEAARAASLIDGSFPVPWAQIIVVPSGNSGGGASFGITGRGGPGSLMLFVPTTAAGDALVSDWVAVHEMTHLNTPFVGRRDSWLTEGIATYYQEILRGRAGLRTPARTFWTLEDGFRRGERSAGTTPIAEATGYEHIYWGGAAIVMEADLELRRQSGGRRSLDNAIAELRHCCASSPRTWTANEVIARIDQAAGSPALSQATERHLHATSFPDVRARLARMGVTVDATTPAHEARLDDSAPDAALRRALLGDTTIVVGPRGEGL